MTLRIIAGVPRRAPRRGRRHDDTRVSLHVDPAVVLSLGAAVSFGMAGVLLRRGLQHASPLTAAVFSVTVTTIFVWLVVAATGPMAVVFTWAILPFLAAGLVAPGLARLAFFTGVQRIGVSRASAVVSAAPLFAIGAAILFLREEPPTLLLGGAALVVAGGALLSYRGKGETDWRRRDLGYPIMAALGFAFRDIVSRWGLVHFPHPLTAAAVATAMSLIVMWTFMAVRGAAGGEPSRRILKLTRREKRNPASQKIPAFARRLRRPDVAWSFHPAGAAFLMMSGLCEGTAYLTMWRALAIGNVSVVSPLVNSHALFAVLLAAVFLRDIERVGWRIAVACGLVVAGVVLVIVSRST